MSDKVIYFRSLTSIIVACFLVLVGVLAPQSQAQTPVGQWTFDGGSGTAAVDSSGNNRTATLVNGVSWVQGENGDAVSAKAAKKQYVSVPSIDLSSTQAVTVTLWANRTYSNVGGHVLFEASNDYTNSTTGFGLFPDDATCNGIRIALRGNVGNTGNCYNQPSSGVWHHLAVVFDKSQSGGNQIQFYIDGVLQTVNWSLNASTNTNNFGNNPIYLFSRAGISQFASGVMDDVRVYASALTAAQVQQLYARVTLVSIAVTPGNASIATGQQQQFTATGTYKDGSQKNLTNSATWTSNATSVAAINSGGLATAVAAGNTTVKATVGSISGSTSLTVTSGSIALDGNVHGVWDNGTNSSTTAAVSIGTPTAGDLISCAVTFDSGNGNSLVSVSDNQNGTYSAAVPVHLNTSMVQWFGIYYKENVAGTPTTITLTTSQSRPYTAISCQAWRGVATSNSLDSAFPQYRDAVSTANPTSGATKVPASNGELILAAVGLLNSGNPTPGANYTLIDGATMTRWWPEYWIQTTVTSTAGNFTWPSDTFTDVMAAFKPSSALSLVSLTITPTSPSLAAGQQLQFTATGTYSDGSQQNLTSTVNWTSSDSSVATISGTGLATAVAVGSTTIKATSGSISGSTALTVTAPTLVSIAVTPTNASLAAGQQQQFTATGTFSDGSQKNLTGSVTWTSSATSVATISNTGLATAVAAGSTTIKATSGSISGSTSLTVTASSLVSIAVTPVNPSLAAGQQQQFTATGTYSDGSQQNLTSTVTWTSSITSIATVSTTGLATAVAAGSTTIKAASGSISGSTVLTVAAPSLVSIAVTPANPSLAAGQQQQFTATGTFSDGSQQNLTGSVIWTSSVTAIATISNTGLATAVAAGSTTLKAASGSLSGSTGLTVMASGARTYTTNFPLTENPISEGGNWTNGLATGLDWHNCQTTPGLAFGTQNGSGAYDDSTCIVNGSWGAVQTVTGTVHSITQTGTQEVELRLHTTITAHSITGYEINLSLGSSRYTQVVRWNGALNNFTLLDARTGPTTIKNGDVFKATIDQSGVISVYINSSLIFTVTDTTYSTGNPGVGFYISNGGVNSNFGFSQFTASATGTPVLASIAVAPTNASLAVGQQQQFTATGTYSDGSQHDITGSVTWTSSASSLATISSTGLATALAPGSTTIKATSSSISGSTALAVTAPTLVSIAVTPANPSLAAGQQQQLTATGTFSDGSQQNLTGSVTWTSSATAVATISNTGLATAVAPGSTTIRGTSGSISGATSLTVTSLPSVGLAWTASGSPGVVGYNAYRSSTSGGPYTKLNSGVISSTSYLDLSVQRGYTYYYVTTAVDSQGMESAYSNEAVATVP